MVSIYIRQIRKKHKNQQQSFNTNVGFKSQHLDEFFGGLLRCFNHSNFWNSLELYGLPHRSKTLPELFSWDDFFKLVSKWLQHFKTQVGKTCFFGEFGSEEKRLLFSEMFLFEKLQKKTPYTNHISNIHIFEPSCFPLVFYSSNCQNQ